MYNMVLVHSASPHIKSQTSYSYLPRLWNHLASALMKPVQLCFVGWYFEVNELILLEEEQARRALEEERMRMEEHARQRDQMIGGPPRGRETHWGCGAVGMGGGRGGRIC